MSEKKQLRGIQWPVTSKDDRSSTETAKKIWAAAFEPLDKKAAKAVLAESKWRFKYVDYIKQHVRASLKSYDSALKGARAGLKAAQDLFGTLQKCIKTWRFEILAFSCQRTASLLSYSQSSQSFMMLMAKCFRLPRP